MELPIGARAMCRDGDGGQLRYVVVDPATDAITKLIVTHRFIPRHDRVVPIRWAASSDGARIVLDASLADLKRLQVYREVEYA